MCKDCKGITLLKGENGVGIVSVTDNNDGTFTILLSNGTTYTSSNLTGAQGPAGTNGAPGGWSSSWVFDASNSPTPPATKIRFDDAMSNFVSSIFINAENIDNVDMSNFLDHFSNTVNGTSLYGLIKVYNKNNSSNFWYGEVTGVSNVGTDYVITVSYIIANDSFISGDEYVVDFTPHGKSVLPYKVYSALISQSGTSDPTVTILENTIGSISWTRAGIGQYDGTLSGAFTSLKTFGLITLGDTSNPAMVFFNRTSDNVIRIVTRDNTYSGVDALLLDASIEIRVYN